MKQFQNRAYQKRSIKPESDVPGYLCKTCNRLTSMLSQTAGDPITCEATVNGLMSQALNNKKIYYAHLKVIVVLPENRQDDASRQMAIETVATATIQADQQAEKL
jgi:hypothetical protein